MARESQFIGKPNVAHVSDTCTNGDSDSEIRPCDIFVGIGLGVMAGLAP